MVGVLPSHIVAKIYNENMDEENDSVKSIEAIGVGSRIRCEDSTGTVKYVGEVTGYVGLWYGIDWDDAERGKHNGSVKGEHYFQASFETSGSFVRPNKITPSITCADAIRKHYGEKEDDNTAALYKTVIDDWKRQIKVPFIEMVGFDSIMKKQGTLDKLVDACVSDMNVWTAGDLATLCPSLLHLDLSKNLIAQWRTVADVVSQLPFLVKLDLSKNRISLPSTDQEVEQLAPSFSKLRQMIITHCNLTWQDVRKITSMLPHLEMLVIASNRITNITTPGSIVNTSLWNLTELVLDSNPIDSWSEVLKLGCLKNLTNLRLNDCQLKDVRFDDRSQGEKTDSFPSLDVLHLKHNLINDWRSVSELDKLSKLQKLYFLKNPLVEDENYDTACQLVIARIGNLKELNGSEIALDSRRGAEYDYLKKYGKEWKRLDTEKQDLKEFLLQHSRFRQLITKHGLPDDSLLDMKPQSNIISTKLIQIILMDEKSGKSFKKKLPSTMSVQKLSALARRLFAAQHRGTHLSEPSLYCLYTSLSDAKEVTVRLDNQLKELDFFSVADGDTVLVKW